MNHRCISVVAFILCGYAWCLESPAQQVLSGISTQEAYIDSEVVFQIQVRNAQSHQPPKVPPINGLQIASTGSPASSTNLTIINGRRTSSSTITYSFLVTPKQEGTFTIPAIEVQVNGKTEKTDPHTFVVTSSETGDLLFVEISSDTKQAYVGQAVKLKLNIWVRPYADRGFEYRFSEADMWRQFSRQTNWGSFADRLEELGQENKRPAGHEVLRKDAEGVSRAYVLYEIESVIYPKRPGEIDPGDVRVVVNYPTQVARSRGDGFFGPSLFDQLTNRRNISVKASRPISAQATLPPIEVLDVPAAERPLGYRGAVGEYRFLVQASPKNVKVGDPITLKLVIQGDGPMELVQAPPLASFPELNQDFRVDNDSLAGFVQDDAKLFTTAIRPLREDVTAIPPIPFSFFDPKQQTFRTINSQAIPITVAANESLSLDSIVANNKQVSATDDQPTAKDSKAAGLELLGVEEMLHEASNLDTATPSKSWLPFAIAPVCCLVGLLFMKRSVLVAVFPTRRNPAAIALKTIREATTASQIRDALNLEDICESEAIRKVRADCDRATFCPATATPLSELRRSALAALQHAGLVLFVVAATSLSADSTAQGADIQSPQLHLTGQQVQTLLSEAFAAQQEALQLKESDAASSKSRYAKAIAKYELVVESEFRSAAVQQNLANAYLESGELEQALVAWESAKQLGVSDSAVAERIDELRAKLGIAKPVAGTKFRQVIPQIPNFVFRGTAICLWSLACFLLTMLLAVPASRRVWSFVLLAGLLVAATAAIYLPSLGSPTYAALAVGDDLNLREADGESFQVISAVTPGEQLLISDRRSDWLLVETTDGAKAGWLPASSAKVLP